MVYYVLWVEPKKKKIKSTSSDISSHIISTLNTLSIHLRLFIKKLGIVKLFRQFRYVQNPDILYCVLSTNPTSTGLHDLLEYSTH